MKAVHEMNSEERATQVVEILMTRGVEVEGRVAVMIDGDPLFTFGEMHERIEALVGRPVWTHEMALPELLANEIRRGEMARLDEVLSKFPPGKPVIVVEVEGDDAQ